MSSHLSIATGANMSCFALLVCYNYCQLCKAGHIVSALTLQSSKVSIVPHRIIWSWYTGRWWVDSYIWYSKEGIEQGRSLPRALLVVPNVTAHPSTASVPITVLLYNGSLLCGFNVAIKGLIATWQVVGSWHDVCLVTGRLSAVSDVHAIGSSQSRGSLPRHRHVGHVPQQRRTDVDIIGWKLYWRHVYVMTCCSRALRYWR